jgi:ribosomal-protein-alanine N-acetyltransferase
MDEICTPRLRLLPTELATPAQREALARAWDDPEVWRYIGSGEHRRVVVADIERGFAYLAALPVERRIEERLVVTHAGEVVGTVGVYPARPWDPADCEHELGYRLGRAFWAQGYGGEAAAAMLERARELGIRLLWARIQPDNTASARLVQRLDFRLAETVDSPTSPGRLEQWWRWTPEATSS